MSIEKALVKQGFKLTSELICDDYNGSEGTHTHKVTLYKDDRSFSTTYTSGCYHRVNPENGASPFHPLYGQVSQQQRANNLKTVPNDPQLDDVLNSLLSDCNCVRFGHDFEDFCEEFDYDNDSRKAEAIFDGCCDVWDNMQYIRVDFDKLEVLFEDF